MKLRIDFGYLQKTISWYKDLKEFPLVISKGGQNWEWLSYDVDPSDEYDHILTFTPQSAYSAMSMSKPPTKFDDLFPEDPYGCHCAAKFDRGFENFHSPYCPKYVKW